MTAGGYERPADSDIRYFLMIGGNPGNMDVWGITFDMITEEVDDKFREMEQKRGLTGVISNYDDKNNVNDPPDYFVEAFQRLNIKTDSMTYTQYLISYSNIDIAYRNNRVYGILLDLYDPFRFRQN